MSRQYFNKFTVGAVVRRQDTAISIGQLFFNYNLCKKCLKAI